MMKAFFLLVLLTVTNALPLTNSTHLLSKRGGCSSPFQGPGCISLVTIAHEAIDTVNLIVDFFGPESTENDQATQIAKELATPTITVALEALAGGASSTGFCVGEYTGNTVASARPGDLLADHGCSDLALKPNEKYLITSFGITTRALESICPSIYPPGHNPTLASFCFAYATCNQGPAIALIMSGPLLSCVAGTPAFASSTSGISQAVATAAKFGLEQVAVGVSTGGDLEYSFQIWDGSAVRNIGIEGNYYDYVQVSLDGVKSTLKLPDNIFDLSGHQFRIVRIPTGIVTSPNDIGNAIRSFAYGSEVFGSMTLKLSSITKGAFPDTPSIKLASSNFLVTSLPASETLPPSGGYLTLYSNDVLKAVVNEFINFVTTNFDSILAALLPSGVSVSDLAKIASTSNSETQLAFTFNEITTGFFVKSPLIGNHPLSYLIGATITFECRVKYQGPSVSCKLSLKESYLFTLVKEGVLWVAYKAANFFEGSSEVIAAVAEDLWDGAPGKWTRRAVQKTARRISEGYYGAVHGSLRTFANKAVYLCGTQVVEDAAKCGVSYVENGARCGYSTITSGAKCGYRTITDGAVCGYEAVTDGARCGWNYLKTGAKCIEKCFPQFKRSCQEKYCKKAKSCNVARSCPVPNSCNWPNSCNIPNTCPVPIDC